ncbi:MAG: hypothetical protein AAFX41_03995 [Bacteroidota bacterium]
MNALERTTTRSWLRHWLPRIGLAVGFVVAYFLVGRPIRVGLIHEIIGPLLSLIDTPRAYEFALTLVPEQPVARLPSLHNVQYYAPGGLYFWAPAALLIAHAPQRPYWLVHGGLVVALSLVGLVGFAIGYGWADWGFDAQRFVEVYVLRTVSIGFPLLVLTGHVGRYPSLKLAPQDEAESDTDSAAPSPPKPSSTVSGT